MKKCVLIFLFLLSVTVVVGQKRPGINGANAPATPVKKSIVNMISSESSEILTGPDGKNLYKVHKGVFQQDFSTLRSDSAYFYPDKNVLDAFGHVNINQGDTLNIFSDKLNYNGNTKLAILTDHVIMVDKDATLTTNYLTYNTALRIAIYNDGGKLVNKDNTLVSKNGYYFALTRDSYFKYNVVCTTPDAIIKTDTLKYNTKDRVAYFSGPTHIYGTKDKDTLYTENGDYNTINEQARFGKKNLYTQGTKSLKGDSLFYDRLIGYGRAVKHAVFVDKEQRIVGKGDLGEYFKDGGRVVLTQNAYMVLITEEKDSTQTDSDTLLTSKTDSLSKLTKKVKTKADSLTIKRLGLTQMIKSKTDSVTINRLGLVNSAKLKADSLTIKKPGVPPSAKTKADSVVIKRPAPTVTKPKLVTNKNATATTTKIKTTTATHKLKDAPITKKPGKLDTSKLDTSKKVKADTLNGQLADKGIKRDSIFIGADTLETQILTYKDYKILQRQRWEAANRDTSIKIVHSVMLTKLPKVISLVAPKMLVDTNLYHPVFFGKPKPKAVAKKKPAKPIDPKKAKLDSIKNIRIADSLQKIADHGLVDTSRIRIISAHHHSKLFKSDLQAKSDSMFYSYSDSTIRMFVNPMIWTQGSQLSGDTIYLQMKNRKLDNMDLFPSSFIVNIEQNDSLHFNQVGGKTMHGTFRNNKLATMLVVGNAETIGFNRDSTTHKVTDMERSVSGSLYSNFKNGEITRGGLIAKNETRANPIALVKEEDKTLKNFIWKPKDRPKSKQDILVSYIPSDVKKPDAQKGTGVKGTTPVKDPFKTDSKTVKDNATAKPDSLKKAVVEKPKFGKPIIYN